MIEFTDAYLGCSDEQSFKTKYLKKIFSHSLDKTQRVFCIETEETVKGFPDVMITWKNPAIKEFGLVRFLEFKISDRTGKIKFQKTQPPFYRRNADMNITVVAYNIKSRSVHTFRALDIFNELSPYASNLKGEVHLGKAEVESESINSIARKFPERYCAR